MRVASWRAAVGRRMGRVRECTCGAAAGHACCSPTPRAMCFRPLAVLPSRSPPHRTGSHTNTVAAAGGRAPGARHAGLCQRHDVVALLVGQKVFVQKDARAFVQRLPGGAGRTGAGAHASASQRARLQVCAHLFFAHPLFRQGSPQRAVPWRGRRRPPRERKLLRRSACQRCLQGGGGRCGRSLQGAVFWQPRSQRARAGSKGGGLCTFHAQTGVERHSQVAGAAEYLCWKYHCMPPACRASNRPKTARFAREPISAKVALPEGGESLAGCVCVRRAGCRK